MKHRNPVPTDRLSPNKILNAAHFGSGGTFFGLGPALALISLSCLRGKRGLWPRDGGNGRRRMHLPPRGESLQWVTAQIGLYPQQDPQTC